MYRAQPEAVMQAQLTFSYLTFSSTTDRTRF